MFKLGFVIGDGSDNVFFKLRKKVLTRLDQIDSNIIDTTLDERLKIAQWFAETKIWLVLKRTRIVQ